jgi:hypothetical protein
MTNEIKIYPCGVCGNSWNDPRATRNNLVLDNGVNSLFIGNLCDGCSKAIHDFVQEQKRELKLKVKEYVEVK